MNEAIIVLTTVENAEDGERIARSLVENALAACVQLLPPMTSIYRWQEKIERASEVLLMIKTTRAAYPAVESAIKQNHPYQTPEVLALPVETGSAAYLNWLTESINAQV